MNSNWDEANNEFNEIARMTVGRNGVVQRVTFRDGSTGKEFIVWIDQDDEPPQPESQLIETLVDYDDEQFDDMYYFSMWLKDDASSTVMDEEIQNEPLSVSTEKTESLAEMKKRLYWEYDGSIGYHAPYENQVDTLEKFDWLIKTGDPQKVQTALSASRQGFIVDGGVALASRLIDIYRENTDSVKLIRKNKAAMHELAAWALLGIANYCNEKQMVFVLNGCSLEWLRGIEFVEEAVKTLYERGMVDKETVSSKLTALYRYEITFQPFEPKS